MSYQRPPVPPPSYQEQAENVFQQPAPQSDYNYNYNYTPNYNTKYSRPEGRPPSNGQSQPNQFTPGQMNGANANDEKYNFESPPTPNAGVDNFDEAFKVDKPKWNDIPFIFLFLATVAGFVVVAVISISYYHSHTSYYGTGIHNGIESSTMNSNSLIVFAIVVSVSLVFSVLILLIAGRWPSMFIKTGLVLNVAFGLATAIYYLVVGYYSAGIVFLVIAVLFSFCYYSLRSRIPFSTTVLRIVIGVIKKYPSCFIVGIIGMLLMGGFSYLFIVTIVSVYAKWGDNSVPESYDQSKLIGLLVFVFFAGYYITEALRTTIHVTLSGIYGTWYYLSKSDAGMPKHAALGSFRRAMTFCFGSICFGSLLVALVQLLRQLINIAKLQALGNGNGLAYCLLIVLDMFAYILDFCLRYFNHYAYSYIALYGKSYLKSARDTYHIFKYKGFDALMNDCIIDTALGIYCFFAGFLAAFTSYMYLRKTKPAYNTDGSYYAPIVAFSFVIAMQVCNVVTTVITSGTATFFLCLAKDPEVFKVSYPDEFDEVFRNYPQVLLKVQTPDR
ncbi:hypothetical protein FOA43_000802 [Brettanomyces nanus]|uniref:Protein PNS1 n=1 Tax=Eeniella nana TaxID=13502 RepID=A0A875RWA5_EENNA|nr:uncharacterized protein FOA43_000802 [Brettanomyces nanus]QPG73491.1 hypothetical protein FOA43_000802 [Brettanomyces nanus]